MTLHLRSVIFSGKVEIENVPIFSCDSCNRSEVLSDVKPELKGLIGELGNDPPKQHVYFNEHNELAYLMCSVSDKDAVHMPVREIVTDRINQLLDLLLLAQSLGDDEWAEDARKRLSQITRHATYDLSGLQP